MYQKWQTKTRLISDPAVKSAIAEASRLDTLGLKNKNTELLGSSQDHQNRAGRPQGQFEGDINAVKALLTKVSRDETRLLAEGKPSEVITRRTQAPCAPATTPSWPPKAHRADKAEQFAAKYSDKVLADSIRAAAIKAGALPESCRGHHPSRSGHFQTRRRRRGDRYRP